MTDKDLKVGYAGSVPGETVDDAMLRYLARREKVDRAIIKSLMVILNIVELGHSVSVAEWNEVSDDLKEALKELEGG